MISLCTAVMNSKLYGPSAQVTHISGDDQCRRGFPFASTAIQSGCAAFSVVVCRVRVGPDQHRHAQLAAARHQFAEHIPVAKPRAAMMERNLGRIVRNAPSAAQANAVRFSSA